jgi:hypothetical protein
MGRPRLRNSGAYSAAERQQRHRRKVKEERRAAQEAASIRGKKDPLRFLLRFNTRLGDLLLPLLSKERHEVLNLLTQIIVANLEHEHKAPGGSLLPLPLIGGGVEAIELQWPDPALWYGHTRPGGTGIVYKRSSKSCAA